jgi:hypothetical protein
MKFTQMRDVVAIAECGSLRAAERHLALAHRLSPAVFMNSSGNWLCCC